MNTFAILGFVFGLIAFTQVVTLPKRIEALEHRVKVLEEKIENNPEED